MLDIAIDVISVCMAAVALTLIELSNQRIKRLENELSRLRAKEGE